MAAGERQREGGGKNAHSDKEGMCLLSRTFDGYVERADDKYL